MTTNLSVGNWDTSQFGANWDSGLEWDITSNVGFGDVTPYLNRITSEHNQQPKFMNMVANVAQPFVDNSATLGRLVSLFDIDQAVGDQLDKVGQWIGVTRYVTIPLTNVYFSFDDASLGFDQGTWFNSFNPNTGVFNLSDPAYRILLRAKISNNQWDGTIPGAYDIWDAAFTGTGIGILIQDLENNHMIFALTGPVPDAVTLALFRGGYLNIKPATVKIDSYITPTVTGAPYFGFDVDNASISGFDIGAWGNAT